MYKIKSVISNISIPAHIYIYKVYSLVLAADDAEVDVKVVSVSAVVARCCSRIKISSETQNEP